MQKAIFPGRLWLDTNGKPIQAHGGNVLYDNGVYFWYGENKELTTGKDGVWHNGVRCYSSQNLYEWKDEGIIIPPEEDENSTLHKKSLMDRPHIVFNKYTKKYVCWVKIMNPQKGEQTMTVLTADRVLGPYRKIREGVRPCGMNAGDFDIAISDDGKAYFYFDRPHTEIVCADLTEDYLGFTGYYSTHFAGKTPPTAREAPAHFLRNGKHYLVTSGTTGYLPNPSEIALASTWHGNFVPAEQPYRGDESRTSFHSQVSCVFKVAGRKDLYIAVADRWAPEHTDKNYEEYGKLYEDLITKQDFNAYFKLKEYTEDRERCTRDSLYVWLPICFDGDKPYLTWKDEWRIEDYEEEKPLW